MLPLKFFVMLFLTLTYLAFELGFNARLLDLVGGNADVDSIKNVELYGRFLSGCAVGLFVFGGMYKKYFFIYTCSVHFFVLCRVFFTLALTFFFVEELNGIHGIELPLALVSVVLTVIFCRLPHRYINIYIALFFSVFSAFFSLKFVIDKIIAAHDAEDRRVALQTVLFQHGVRNDYVKLVAFGDEQKSGSSQEKAFLALLPFYASGVNRIESKIEKAKSVMITRYVEDRIGTPGQVYNFTYLPEIERAREKWRTYKNGGIVFDDGYRIPKGLSFQQFVATPPMQIDIKNRTSFVGSTVIRADYRDSKQFENEFYRPYVAGAVKVNKAMFDADVKDFYAGKKYYKDGVSALEKTVIPVFALFCSLFGAIAHLGKLIMICIKQPFFADGRRAGSPLSSFLIVFVFICTSTLGILSTENTITSSEMYRNVERQIEENSPVCGRGLNAVFHLIIVGQGLGYPIFEWTRENVLFGISYGVDINRE